MEPFALLDSASPISHVVIDSRNVVAPDTLFVALPGRYRDGHDFVADAAARGARFALVSDDWIAPPTLPAIQLVRHPSPLAALQQIAGAYRRQRSASVIAITGSQGKTMLKDMLQCYLSDTYSVVVSPESFNSQIGVPLSLFNIRDSHQIAIIEAGISQPGEMATLAEMIAPTHALLTQVGEQHLASLKSRQTIATEKSLLLKAVNSSGWIMTPDDPLLQSCLQEVTARHVHWNQPDPTMPQVQALPSQRAGSLPFVVQFPDGHQTYGELSFGFTYLLDLMSMAVKAAWLLKVPSKVLAERIAGYRPESTRTEIWRAPGGVTLVNRPYCAEPQGVVRGLDLLRETPSPGRKHLVFGGFRSAGSATKLLRQLASALRHHGLHRLCLYGNDSFQPLVDALPGVTIENFATCDDALESLRETTLPGDYILVQGPTKQPVDRTIAAFDDSVSHNHCHINLAAVRHNLSALRGVLKPQTRLMVIVKALAYGTDDVRMARFLASCGVDSLGVSYVDEGVALKRAGIQQTVFALNVAPYEIVKAVKWDIEVGVQALEGIEALAAEAQRQGKCARVHLHVDTGMGRLGCRPEDAIAIAKRIVALPSLQFEGLMTHFSSADDPSQDAFTRHQIHLFKTTLSQLQMHGIAPRYAHAAGSAAALRFPEAQFNMVRIGLALYGLHASHSVRAVVDLQPALSVTSRVVGINSVKAGDSVGYSRRYQVPQESGKIAVLPIGYFDGRHRHHSEKGVVMIRGQRAPLVGNICMDYLMVDVSHIPDVQVGDPVLIFGEDEYGQKLPAEEVATTGGSIAHELVACLGPRIQRLFVDEL